jgi:CPA1 family monovalent cation:H+ antiporter
VAAGLDYHLVAELLAVVAGLALVARRTALPAPVILLVVGLVASEFGWGLSLSLQPEEILFLFLPPLLFAGAFQLDLRLLRQSLWPILLLAIPGVLVATATVGLAVHVSLGWTWAAALLCGAVLAATDPVSVLALFRRVGAPARLAVIVEGESLLNDGTALVVFGALLSIISGHASAPAQASSLALEVMGGSAVGLALGYVGSHVTALIDDHLVEMTLSTALAYGSYMGATAMGGSGVLATVCAGLVLGSYGRQIGMSKTTMRLLDDLWDYLSFFATAVLFLLIGVTIPGHDLVHAPRLVVVGTVAVVIARIVVLYGLAPLVARGKDRLPMAYRHVLFWGGLRGAVGVTATLSLPLSLAHRHDIQTLAYGAIVVTLVVQGMTIGPLVRFLRLQSAVHQASSLSSSPTEDAPSTAHVSPGTELR